MHDKPLFQKYRPFSYARARLNTAPSKIYNFQQNPPTLQPKFYSETSSLCRINLKLHYLHANAYTQYQITHIHR